MKYVNIAGVVTLYNPDESVYENIKTYCDYIDKLYVILNSKISNYLFREIESIPNVIFIKKYENIGIAKAVNVVLDEVKGKYSWLLTMDQDSCFDENVCEYFSAANDVDIDCIYGITSLITENKVLKKEIKYEYIDRCITSGMLLNVELAIRCNGLNEKLFIDEVDYELCYRCNRLGYKLIRIPIETMKHVIGAPKVYKIFNRFIKVDNENAFRNYYIFRNCMYVMYEYPEKRMQYIFSLMKRFIKILIFEDNKINKITFVFMGVRDFILRRMGKLDYKKIK